jgi:hypothetical protein
MSSKLEKPLSFKASVLEAFHRLGGVDSMVLWAAHNPTEFYKIAARLIPQELSSAGDGSPVQIVINRITLNPADPTPPDSALRSDRPLLQPASTRVIDVDPLEGLLS